MNYPAASGRGIKEPPHKAEICAPRGGELTQKRLKMRDKIKLMHMTLSMDHGGLERIVNQFVKKINKDDFEVSICCLDRGGYFLDEIPGKDIKKFIFNRNPGILDFKLLLRLFNLVRREKIDVLHSHTGCSFYAALAGRVAGVKGIVHTDHGRLTPDRKGLILEDRISSMMINAYVAVSSELAGYLQNKVKICKEKLLTFINGVDTEHFKPFPDNIIREIRKEFGIPADAEVIGTVCRLDPVKNLIFLIQTLKDILRTRDQTILLIVGNGPMRMHMEDVINKLGLNKKIILLGKRADVERIMPILDIFILPSISEGTSMTILEAMSCSVPVIASMVGGNRFLIREGRNGYLFPLDSPQVLVEEVIDLLKNKNKRTSMGKEGRRIVVDEFSFQSMLDKYTEIYRSLA